MSAIPPLKSFETWNTTVPDRIGASWNIRERHTKQIGWCVLTLDTAKILSDFIKRSQVVEVFAGTGYIAHHLRKMSGLSRKEYRAYDNRSSHRPASYFPGVTKKNAFMAPIKKADIVIMTWPAYATNDATRIVKKMNPGQCLIFNGEGDGGCTGDDEFFSVLEDEFVRLDYINGLLDKCHFSFSGIHDRWTVYQKRLQLEKE